MKLHDPESVVYTWIDPTVSMEYVENGTTLKSRAGAVLDSFIATLPSSVKHYNYHHSNGHFLQLSRGENVDFESRFGPVDLKRAVETFLYEEKSEKSSLILVSDFQKSTADLLDSLTEKTVLLKKTVICVSVAPDRPWNHSVRVVGQAGGGTKIAARIHARGKGLDSVGVAAHFSSLRAGQVRVGLENGDSAEVVLSVPSEVSGSPGKIGLDMDDPLAFDNIDHFSPQADRSRCVLIVGNREQNGVIAAALKVSPGDWGSIELREGGELTYDDLNKADLVIVNSLGGYSRMLESFVSGSGVAEKGIVLCLDPDAEHDFASGLLRKRVAGSLSSRKLENGVNPVLTDTVSELWQGFPDVKSENARIYRYTNPLPGNMLVGLENREALVTQYTIGSGKWILCSSPLGVTLANNLCETGFYLPLVDRLAQQAVLKDRELKDVWYAGYSKRNPFYGREQEAVLYDENGKLVATWSTQPYVSVEKPGLYKLVPSGGESFEIAVTWHPSESEMLYTLPYRQNPDNIYYFKSGRFLKQIRDLANNIWSYVLWILLGLFTCAEVFFWHVGSKKKASEFTR